MGCVVSGVCVVCEVCVCGEKCVWFVCCVRWVCCLLCVVCEVCMVCVSVCGVFLINIYLQHVPLHGNTTCSSVHMIHCLSFWSVFGTTCGNLFRTFTITVLKINSLKESCECFYVLVCQFVLWRGPGPSAAHYCLYYGTSLCLENITFEDYVVGCLLCFFTGTHAVVC